MAEPGVVALDPVRLAGLESHLQGLASGLDRAVGEVEGHLAGTGEAVPGEVGDLRRLAEWCRVEGDGVRWRRRAVEALPVSLPLPAWPVGSSVLARSRADALAPRLAEALEGDPPDWAVMGAVLAQVRRGCGDPAFTTRLIELVGPRALVLLPVDIARAAAATTATPADVRAARAAADDLLDRAERPPRPTRSSVRWWDALEGMGAAPTDALVGRVERAGRDGALARDLVSGVVGALRLARSAEAAAVSPLAVVGLASDVVGLVDEPEAVDVLSTVASALRTAAPLLGAAGLAVYGGAVALTLVAWAEAHDLPDDERDVRRDDTGTGERRYPSGSASNPDVDTAGVPLAGYA